MLGYIYRLARNFETEHGLEPNLLYINPQHCEYLKDSFENRYSLQKIMSMLGMEVIIDHEIVHPRVSWAQSVLKNVS